MLFGFIVDRSEYYGLPTFLLTVALTVCGAYLAIADNITAPLKLFYCFLSPSVALTMGIIVIESYLYHHNGAMDYSYINENKQYPNLKDINGVIIAASIMYFGIILLMPFDWLFRHTNSMEMYIASKNDDIKYPCDNEEEEREANLDNDTAITEAQNTLLNVTSLSQVYPDGTHAVKDMNFRIKKGEVLSFLGANGAGKSTTMKMLCGTLDATYGDANVNGYSITTQRTLARRNLGIAMQQDIIWDDVNVEDHLMLFGRLRGLHGKVLRDAVTAMADSLGFPEKRKSLAGTLSGGQKRRLCVGLSMVGGNSVVYLDEPTAGLDPLSRRQLWDLVQRNREGRAILLTTHFMDEADVLGDRIAIVKEGRLRALGTSKFLKNRFGLGYLLRMSLRSDIIVDPNAINDFVKQWIPECSIASNAGTELSLRLPRDAVSVFAEVFEQLETRSKDLGILSYGIETTTLEEVFMRIVNEDNEQLVADHDASNRMLSAPAEERDKNREELNKRDEQRNPLREDQISALLTKGDNSSTSICADSIGGQIVVMLKKRFFQFVRSRGQWAMGVGIPLSIAVLASLLLSTMPSQLITSNYPEGFATVSNLHPTFVAGPTEQSILSLMNDAFGSAVNPQYIGSNYSSLYNTIDDIASAGFGETSLDGVVYDSLTNFTVIYNASYPINFPGLVQGMLNSAVANATDNMLVIDQIYNSLPHDKLNSQLNTAFYFAMLVSLIAGSFGAGLSIVVSGERVNLVKHQQLASGASTLAYWVGNFIFDSTLMGGYMFIFVAILALINPSEYGHEGYGEVILPGIFFVLATIFRNYSFSYFINDVKLAQSIYFYGSIAAVFILTDVWFQVLFNTAKCNISNSRVAIMSYIFTIIDPTFGWYLGMLYLNNFLGILTQHPNSNYFIQEIGGGLFISLIISSLLYGFIFIFITENAFGYIFQSIWNSAKSNLGNVSSSVNIRVKPMTLQEEEEYRNELSSSTTVIPIPSSGIDQAIASKQDRSYGSQDIDVIQERLRVQKIVDRGLLNPNLSAIFIHDLRKVYYARGNIPAKVAVKNVNISIPQGEIFGLLGANGAGKTTLLKMVSGQESPSSGFALINGFDVVNQTNAAQRSMGLCPQFDTLVERLSVRENLLFFGRLKGLSATDLIPVVEAFMQAMNIKRYENKLIQHLSGGNRRKVSLTVALIGAPPTVYLDEPSTGLDPVACRLMWRLLSKIAASKSTAIVLTTHSMIECEAVCTRVCIMKLGEMVCLGDSQHLRSTHGTGFQLELNLKSSDGIELAKKFIETHFSAAILIEEHATLLNYEIPRNAISRLSQTFKLLEDNKQTLLVDDYVLSQSTLEQVFLKQIRPNANDIRNQQDQKAISDRVSNFNDYVTVYIVWLLAAFIPGAHHFYLGNTWRGLKYFFTYNEVMAGWILDLFELHVLLQKSVQERGHVQGFLWCSCCNALWYIFCCFGCFGFFKAKATKQDHVHNTEEVEDGHNVVTAQPINDDAV